MKKRKLVDLSHTIPPNPTDVWSNDTNVVYFFDRGSCVELFQKVKENGHVQHLTLTPQNYINFTSRLQSSGFKNATAGHIF